MGMGVSALLQESAKDGENRNELSHKKKSKPEQVKVVIDNILFTIKMNTSVLSVQQIHDHMTQYVCIPKGWRSKNYSFEFVNSINQIVQNGLETMCNVKNAPWHTLIVDESTDIMVHKMPVLYIKYREENDVSYKTVFGGIIQLTACTAHDIKIPHLTEQNCMAHREDLGIDDLWKDVPLMRDVETLLRTVYSTFSRSTVKRGKMEDLAKILNEDTLSVRPLREVRWLSRHQALNAVLRNYTVLEEYCKRGSSDNRVPVANYCSKKLRDSKFRLLSLLWKMFFWASWYNSKTQPD